MSNSQGNYRGTGIRLIGCTVLPVLVFGFEGNVFEAVACLTVAAVAAPAYSACMLVLALLLAAPAFLGMTSGFGMREAFLVLPKLYFGGFQGAEILLTAHSLILLERVVRRRLLGSTTTNRMTAFFLERYGEVFSVVCFAEAALCAYAAWADAMPPHHAVIWGVTLVSLGLLTAQAHWSAVPDEVLAYRTRKVGRLFGIVGAGHLTALVCGCLALTGANHLGVRPEITIATGAALIGLGVAGLACIAMYVSLARRRRPVRTMHLFLAAAHLWICPVGTIVGLYGLRILIVGALRARQPSQSVRPGNSHVERAQSAAPRESRPRIRPLIHVIGLIGVYLFVFTAMWVQLYRVLNPPVTSVMILRSSAGVPISQDWIALGKLPEHFVPEVLNAEDCGFYRHYGFDWKQMRYALQIALRGEKGPGASTITQQVAKNCFLWPQRSWIRKGLEAYFAVLIEMSWEKDRILEVYVNVAEMGRGIFGAESGAQAFYAKPASQLTNKESLRLIKGLPRAGFIVPGELDVALAVRKDERSAGKTIVAVKRDG